MMMWLRMTRSRSRFLAISLLFLGILGQDGSCLSPARRGSFSSFRQSDSAFIAEPSMLSWGCGVCMHPVHGFKDPNELSWPKFHKCAVAFRQHFGHCNIPDGCGVLHGWIEAQKMKRMPSATWADRILGLGFEGVRRHDEPSIAVIPGNRGVKKTRKRERNPGAWDAKFAELLKFRDKYGHTDVPSKWQTTTEASKMNKTESSELSTWVHNQRLLQHRGELYSSRVEKLAGIGFNFRLRKRESRVRQFEDYINDLLLLAQATGGSKSKQGMMTVHGMPIQRLNMWLMQQRRMNRVGKLSEHRITWLQRLGVNLKMDFAGSWDKMYASLKAFKEVEGHCDVPQTYKPDPQLARWVNNQRYRRKSGRMQRGREAKLRQIDFLWRSERKQATFGGR